MENTKTTDTAKRPAERVKNTSGGGGCSFWIFGDEDSAKKDLDKAFEVIDNEKD